MSLSIINSVFALGAESAYLGTLGVRALEGDLGAALTAAAMAEAATDDSWSQAPTAMNDARRFAATPSDWCDCLRKPGALEELRARFDPAEEYSDEEKLEIAKAMFDAVDEIYAEGQRRVREIVEGRGDMEALAAWIEGQRDWFSKVDRQLRATSRRVYILSNAFSSSYTQPMAGLGASVQNIREILSYAPSSLSTSRGVAAILAEEKPHLFDGTRGYRPTPSRGELARTLALVLTHGAHLSWEGKILVVRRTTSPWANWPKREEFHGFAGWPLNLEEFYLKNVLEVLGWRITQEVAGDTVTLRIGLGASTYPKPDLMEEARRELWARFESLQGEMEVMKKELIRKIQSQEEALSIANWLAAETKRLKRVAGELGDLNKKLFQAGILEEPMKYAVSSFLHDRAIRDLHTLEMLAGSILEGATGRLEKILRYFAPLPAGMQSLLERMTDDFYLRAAARGVSLTSRCMEPTQGQITQLVESVSLELVEGILANLVENGIKYSDPNKPRRNVALIYNGDENILEYRDNGIGVNPAFAARLGSEPGLRELDRVGDVKGTGTGWMIMTHNLRALGWTYEIETAPGAGLKVRIRIPPEHLIQVR